MNHENTGQRFELFLLLVETVKFFTNNKTENVNLDVRYTLTENTYCPTFFVQKQKRIRIL